MHTEQLAGDWERGFERSTPSEREGTLTRRNARYARARRYAKGLGWFSIGLGVAELVAPDQLARLIGVRPNRRTRTMLRFCGAREISAGIGILGSAPRAGWLWTRVLGDAMDVALLGRSFLARKSEKDRVMGALGGVLAVTALDAWTGARLGRREHSAAVRAERGIHVTKAITIYRSQEDVYRFWHDFENLPRFMAHLESVETNNGISRWRAKGPAGKTVEWEAEIVRDEPNQIIAWKSRVDSDVANSGSVQFRPAPGGRGTEVRVELRYDPPAGKLGAAVAKLFGREPSQAIEGDLRRFKQVMEIGEVLHSDASIHRGPHPARPPKRFESNGKQVVR